MGHTPVLEIAARPTRPLVLVQMQERLFSQNGFSKYVSKRHDLFFCGEAGGAQFAFTKTFQTTPIARNCDSDSTCSKHAPNRIQHLVKEGAAPLTSSWKGFATAFVTSRKGERLVLPPLIRSI